MRYTSPVEMATERYPRSEDMEVGARRYRAANWFWRCSARPTATTGISRNPIPRPRPRSEQASRLRAGRRAPLPGSAARRMEGQIALTALLRRFPGARLAITPEGLHWRRGLFLRGLELPLIL